MGGGIGLLIGIFTPTIAALLALQFVTIIVWKLAKRQPFVGGWEFDLLIFAALLVLALNGAGVVFVGPRFSSLDCERMVKRFFEILPGGLAWATIILMFLLSWLLPVWVSVFIILFDIYWLLKTVYLSLHLRATFSAMKKNMEVDWRARLPRRKRCCEGYSWEDIYHLVILPMYHEPYEVVRESFARLLEAHYPKEKLFVVLAAGGARGRGGAARWGSGSKKNSAAVSADFLLTVHPADLPGEIPGKGSNETWAALRAKETLIDPLKITV